MAFRVTGNLVQNRLHRGLSAPSPHISSTRRIENNPRQIKRARRGIHPDCVPSETRFAPGAELAKRPGGLNTPGNIEDAVACAKGGGIELLFQQRDKIAGM